MTLVHQIVPQSCPLLTLLELSPGPCACYTNTLILSYIPGHNCVTLDKLLGFSVPLQRQ